MKAWLLKDFAGLDALAIGEAPDPAPGRDEVLLELQYAGLNPADRYLAEGQYPAKPPLPHILGRDGVGAVVAVGKEAGQFQIGQKLMILRGETGVTRPGTFAQRVAVSADSLVPLPPGWTVEESAGASLVYLTAYQALMQWGELPPSVVLVTGASGGVGVASIQLAKALGHTVVGLSRDAQKSKTLVQLGAAHVADPSDPQWPQKLKKALAPRRVDLAIDTIGGAQFNKLLEMLGDHGKISVVGRLAGPVPEFNTATMFFRRLRIGGVAVGAYTPAQSRAAWEEALRLLQRTGARPLVDRIFLFDQLIAAFERLARGPMGKVLLNIQSAGTK